MCIRDSPRTKQFKDFSRGMKMKLAIAAALSHGAKLLLLDEATSGPVSYTHLMEVLGRGIPAGYDDFDTEFLDYILAVRVVDSVEEAIAHINCHSTCLLYTSRCV